MTDGLIQHADGRARCWWCGTDPLYMAYHDTEWGVPERNGRALYEKLILDGFQAGLSWITILRKRDAFRRAFANFEPAEIARFTEAHVEALMLDAGIVRNRSKIEGTILSARVYGEMGGAEAFSQFLWGYVGDAPLQTRRETRGDIPPADELSRDVSAALKKAGFKYCGPTIVYAFMQACGLINDHLVGCHRHLACEEAAAPRDPARGAA